MAGALRVFSPQPGSARSLGAPQPSGSLTSACLWVAAGSPLCTPARGPPRSVRREPQVARLLLDPCSPSRPPAPLRRDAIGLPTDRLRSRMHHVGGKGWGHRSRFSRVGVCYWRQLGGVPYAGARWGSEGLAIYTRSALPVTVTIPLRGKVDPEDDSEGSGHSWILGIQSSPTSPAWGPSNLGIH